MIKKLDFTLEFQPDTLYRSEALRDIWEYRKARILMMEQDLETLSVEKGLRKAARKIIKHENIASDYIRYKDRGLKIVPLSNTTLSSGYRLSTKRGDANAITTLITREDTEIKEPSEIYSNNISMGYYLGYPDCCTSFFERNWTDQGFKDSVFHIAMNTKDAVREGNTITVPNSPKGNSILKFMSVRATFHMPHSFDCKETERIADELTELALENGYEKEIAWRDQLLSSEIEWSSLHGIAVITTPVSKTRMATDSLAEKHVVIHEGHRDFKMHTKKLWTLNGFSGYKGMESSHDMIEKAIRIKDIDSILDYGAGNGYLLSKLDVKERVGLEKDSDAINYGQEMFPSINLILGDINYYTLERDFDVILISSPRFLEAERVGRLEFLKEQLKHGDTVLVYEYSDGLTIEQDTLEYLASKGIEAEIQYVDNSTRVMEVFL